MVVSDAGIAAAAAEALRRGGVEFRRARDLPG
jgi:hypothetical protein